VDFRDPKQYAEKLEELLRALLHVPKNIEPPLGPNPFQPVSEDATLFAPSLIEQPVELPKAEGLSPEKVYETCQMLFRRGDAVGWYELVKSVRSPVETNLLEWRRDFTECRSGEAKDLYSTIDEGVEVVAPLIALALASVESRQPQFNDQRSILDDLIQISKWPETPMMVGGMLEALAYVYHYLHGATCMMTNQLQVALRFATMRVRYANRVDMLWKQRLLSGWPTGFEGNTKKAWEYIVQAHERLPWLGRIFPRSADYDHTLAAYGMVLTALECAEFFSKPEEAKKILGQQQRVLFDVPPMFANLPKEVLERAFTTAFPDATAVQLIAATSSIDPQVLREHWRGWNEAIARILRTALGRMWWLDVEDIWVGELP